MSTSKVIKFFNPSYSTSKVYLGTAVTIDDSTLNQSFSSQTKESVLKMAIVPLVEREKNPKTGLSTFEPIGEVNEYYSVMRKSPISNFLEENEKRSMISVDKINQVAIREAAKKGWRVLTLNETSYAKDKVYTKRSA